MDLEGCLAFVGLVNEKREFHFLFGRGRVEILTIHFFLDLEVMDLALVDGHI